MAVHAWMGHSSDTAAAQGDIAASILALIEQGFPVPTGFVIAEQTQTTVFEHNHLGHKISQLIERVNPLDTTDLLRVSDRIKQLILEAEIPSVVAQSLIDMALRLGEQPVMLSMSASHTHTAHVHRVFGLTGDANIIIGVRRLWGALFDAPTIATLARQEHPILPLGSICIQRLPPIVASGILDTRTQTDKQSILVRAVFGAGALSGDLSGADSYWVNKESGALIDQRQVPQLSSVQFLQGEQTSHTLDAQTSARKKLRLNQLRTLTDLAIKLQHHSFFPQEAVWVFDGTTIALLWVKRLEHEIEQETQPEITVTTTEKAEPHAYNVLLKGVGGIGGIITGRIRHISNDLRLPSLKPGDILVAADSSHIPMDALKHVQGIILENAEPSAALAQAAREHGVVTLHGAAGAHTLLEQDSFVTIHSPTGEVLAGAYSSSSRMVPVESHPRAMRSATKVGTMVSLQHHMDPAKITTDGSICIFPTPLIMELGSHPRKVIKDKRTRAMSTGLATRIKPFMSGNKPVLYRISDITTSQYRSLVGGKGIETTQDENPLLGFHGSVRLLREPDLIETELRALKTLLAKEHPASLGVVLPTVRFPFEIKGWRTLLREHGINQHGTCRYLVDITTPALLWQIPALLKQNIDGLLIDVDALIALLFAIDPSTDNLPYHFDDVSAPFLVILASALDVCREQGVSVSLHGKLVAHDDIVELAVQHGVSELIVEPQDAMKVQSRLLFFEEQKVIHHA